MRRYCYQAGICFPGEIENFLGVIAHSYLAPHEGFGISQPLAYLLQIFVGSRFHQGYLLFGEADMVQPADGMNLLAGVITRRRVICVHVFRASSAI